MIRRWDPYREMMMLRNSMDREVDRELALSPTSWKSFNWSVALDVVESEDEYLVKASLPGINPEDLDVTFDPVSASYLRVDRRNRIDRNPLAVPLTSSMAPANRRLENVFLPHRIKGRREVREMFDKKRKG